MEEMLCKSCSRCGLCPGDGSFEADKNLIISAEGISLPLKADPSLPAFYVGIAVDIGTTTVAAKAFRLCDAELLAEYKEANVQQRFGSDVIARVSFAMEGDGYLKLRKAILLQMEKAVKTLLGEVSFLFYSQRVGRPHLERIVVVGNTAMQSFAAGVGVKGLSAFPFEAEYLFGEEKPAHEFFGSPSFLPGDCPVYFAPSQSAFVGGDAVAAMLACGFAEDDGAVKILCDVGTNCEMALADGKGRVFCTSSAAGPAFEGYGIKQGMCAAEGAVAKVALVRDSVAYGAAGYGGAVSWWAPRDAKGYGGAASGWVPRDAKGYGGTGSGGIAVGKKAGGGKAFAKNSRFLCSVIGGGDARGICGTGLLSAVSLFYRTGIINQNGTFLHGTDSVALCGGVRLWQGDIRNFQLAKAAVLSGIEVLMEKAGISAEDCALDARLYLAGGFGTKLDAKDAAFTGMIPQALGGCVVHAGNAALGGACMLLFSENIRKEALSLARKAESINLSEEEGFQERYISALNFPSVQP